MTVISNGETGAVLAVVPHRDFMALSGFFSEHGPSLVQERQRCGHRWLA